jgi:hypothetical protein
VAGVARIDAGEALYALGEMIIGRRPIDVPPAGALAVAGGPAEAAVILGKIGVFEPYEVKTGGLGGHRGVVRLTFREAAAISAKAIAPLGKRNKRQ